jgi:hypothetical protein
MGIFLPDTHQYSFTFTFHLQVSKNSTIQEGRVGTADSARLGPEPFGDHSKVGSGIGSSSRSGGVRMAEKDLFTTLSNIKKGHLMCVLILIFISVNMFQFYVLRFCFFC